MDAARGQIARGQTDARSCMAGVCSQVQQQRIPVVGPVTVKSEADRAVTGSEKTTSTTTVCSLVTAPRSAECAM